MGMSKTPLSFFLYLYKSLNQVVFISQLFSYFSKLIFFLLEPLYFHISFKTSLHAKACEGFAHVDNLDEHPP